MTTSHTTKDPVAIVGGGLGGLSAAVTLAARGYRVALYEKNEWLGGKAAVLERDGFRFDMGPTILSFPTVLRRLVAETGRSLDEVIPLVRLDPQWRCYFEDGAELDLVEDIDAMAANLDRFAPDKGLGQGYRDLQAYARELYDIADQRLLWRSLGGLLDMMKQPGSFPRVLGDITRIRPTSTLGATMRKFVPDGRVAQMLDHFTQYVGSDPFQSPAVLTSIAHIQADDGIWYPVGGLGAIPAGLRGLAEELGVEFHTGVEVTRLEQDASGRVVAIETEPGGRRAVSAVVSNMDSVRTYDELLGGGRGAQAFRRDNRTEPACSGVVLYLGLDRRYEHLAHHSFAFSEDPEEEFRAIYGRGEPPEDPTVYIAAPSVTDPTVAPEGGEALYLLSHTPYLRDHHDWSELLPAYRDRMIDKVARLAGMPDLESRIVVEEALTPEGIRDRYWTLDGAIYGLASHGRVVGAFKPANRREDVPGLYLAGGSANPGPGVPMVLMSGWIAADTLDRDGLAEAARDADAVAPAAA